jgi:hypothetical protein
MNQKETSTERRSLWRIETIPYVFYTLVGVAVLYVVGSIALEAQRNGGLLPPPTKLERFECAGPGGSFSIGFLQGSDRVQIKSPNGFLDGTVSQNRFDWQGFGNDRNVLGFAPPQEMVSGDNKTMRINGPDLNNVLCNNTPEASNQPRAATQ